MIRGKKICKKAMPLIVFEFCSVLVLLAIGVYLSEERTVYGVAAFLYQYYKIYIYVLVAVFGSAVITLCSVKADNWILNLICTVLSYIVSIFAAYLLYNGLFDNLFVHTRHLYFYSNLLGLAVTFFVAAAFTAIFWAVFRKRMVFKRIVSCIKGYRIELIVFLFFLSRQIMTNSGELNFWCSAWYAMDYQTFGVASRMLPGTILSLLLPGEYIDYSLANIYVFCILILITAIISIMAGQVVKKCESSCRSAVIYLLMLYMAAPFSLEYLYECAGRPETFAILFALIAVIGFHGIRNDVASIMNP